MWHRAMYETTKLTVELREIVESGVDIWKFDYPSFYEGEAKTKFEKKVIDHYYFRQIGQETVGRWLHYFRSRMNEIMPYYIQLYESEAIMKGIKDPFESYNLTETYEEEHSSQGSSSGLTTDSSTSETSSSSERSASGQSSKSGSVDNIKKFSNTPQGSVDNLENYLTEATIDNGNSSEASESSESGSESSEGSAQVAGQGTSEATSEDSGTVKHTLTRKGNIGVQPLGKEMEALRQSFLNIDMMIINELNDLFLGIY